MEGTHMCDSCGGWFPGDMMVDKEDTLEEFCIKCDEEEANDS